jgi:hypothetical protein
LEDERVAYRHVAVARDHDEPAPSPVLLDQRLEPQPVGSIERHPGLVEKPKRSRNGEEASEREPAPLAGGEGLDRIFRSVGEAEGLEGSGDAFRPGSEKGGLQEKRLGDAERTLQAVGEAHEM